MTKDTHLNFMADIFDRGSEGIESVGDMLLSDGEWLSGFCVYVWIALVARKLWLLRT